MTRVGDETVSQFDHGRKGSIGTTAVAICDLPIRAAKGVEIAAASGNAGTVFVGNADVTTGSDPLTDGYPLEPGERLFLPIDDPRKVFVRSASGTQTVYFVVA